MQMHMVVHSTDWLRKLREVLIGNKDHGIAMSEFCSTLKKKSSKIC